LSVVEARILPVAVGPDDAINNFFGRSNEKKKRFRR
jgi:hypothetical protein